MQQATYIAPISVIRIIGLFLVYTLCVSYVKVA